MEILGMFRDPVRVPETIGRLFGRAGRTVIGLGCAGVGFGGEPLLIARLPQKIRAVVVSCFNLREETPCGFLCLFGALGSGLREIGRMRRRRGRVFGVFRFRLSLSGRSPRLVRQFRGVGSRRSGGVFLVYGLLGVMLRLVRGGGGMRRGISRGRFGSAGLGGRVAGLVRVIRRGRRRLRRRVRVRGRLFGSMARSSGVVTGIVGVSVGGLGARARFARGMLAPARVTFGFG